MSLQLVATAAPTRSKGSGVGGMLRRFHLTIPQSVAHRLAAGGLLESWTTAVLLAAAAVAGITDWVARRRRARGARGPRAWRWGARGSLAAGAVLGLMGLGVGVNAYAGYVPSLDAAVALATGHAASA